MLNHDVEENDAYTIYCKLPQMSIASDNLDASEYGKNWKV